VHYSSLFQSFFLSIYYRPYSSWKFLYTSLLTFLQIVVLTDWWTHAFRIIRFCALIISVSITILCLLCSPCYTAVRIKNCSKSTSEIEVATMKNTMVPHAPVIIWNWSIHCPFLSAMFDSLHSSTNQELFEKHLSNKSSHHEKYRRFLFMQRKPSRATIKLTSVIHCQQRWMEHKGEHW